MKNPFNITKAVDYTDSDIINYWVDILEGNGFKDLLKPTSSMPMLVLGSKGSGKTHLMRYFSYQLQKYRAQSIKDVLAKDQYIGIYLRASGLNSDRFKGKGQSIEKWDVVFAYNFELWVGQLILEILKEIISSNEECNVVQRIMSLFEKSPTEEQVTTIVELETLLKKLQNEVDFSSNNAALTGSLSQLEIYLSPGKFIFGIPRILAKEVSDFKNLMFLYLFDEFENFTENQQKLINTLYREKDPNVTFRIGARLYGIKTFGTLGGEEENKEGSEFEKVVLDSFFREHEDQYENFVREICLKRLKDDGLNIDDKSQIDSYFAPFSVESFLDEVKGKKYNRSHLERLERELKHFKPVPVATVSEVVRNLEFRENLLVEKAKLFLFYRAWSSKKGDLQKSAIIIKTDAEKYTTGVDTTETSKVLSYFKNDLVDQIARDSRERMPYYSFSKFIKMSNGVPRNLLNILKHIYRWSYFNDNIQPFKEGKISLESQYKGVLDTTAWFFEENRIPAEVGKKAVIIINRIGRFLQAIRFSELPPECSLCSFAISKEYVTADVERILEFLVNYSFLIVISSDRRAKNSHEQLLTYQINGVVAPEWELPTARRGTLHLQKKEVEVIFNTADDTPFKTLISEKTEKYNAPFYGQSTITLFELW
ncbi:ORC-CDC6 family AAA ATPase [Pseudocnuella soli]|uniref:ORC-CDC6 family AAA ATPase n=1 Tax=Pseudocnuella soli TaxID=2502779 RepID=UPI00104D90B0|nr:hypothetical protein [Pseudocnuella soli]